MSQFESNEKFNKYLQDAKTQNSMIAFLNRSNLWPSVESAINRFLNDLNEHGDDFRLAPIVCEMSFDMTKIQEECLLECLATEPYEFGQVLNQTIYTVVTTYLEKIGADVTVRLEQIHVLTQCSNLPTIDRYNLMCEKNGMRKGLSNFCGILTGYSDVKKSIRYAIWYCPNQCPLNAITTGLLFKPLRCEECQAEMLEYSKHRHMSDYICLDLLPIEAVRDTTGPWTIHRSLRVRVNDELTQMRFTLGHEYRVSGLYDGHTQLFVAWDIESIA